MTGPEIAVLGAGMHPWGKWGRNFVEYGIEAANIALADAGVEWRDIQFVAGAATMRNGYPGDVSAAPLRPALRRAGAPGGSSYPPPPAGAPPPANGRAPTPPRV